MIRAVKICFAKYFVFSGRARRAEHWYFVLFYHLASIPPRVIDRYLETSGNFIPIAELVLLLAVTSPLVAVTWRRMHDIGRPGWQGILHWFATLPLLPFIFFGDGGSRALRETYGEPLIWGMLAIIVALFLLVMWWLVKPTQQGPNAYGEEPPEW